MVMDKDNVIMFWVVILLVVFFAWFISGPAYREVQRVEELADKRHELELKKLNKALKDIKKEIK